LKPLERYYQRVMQRFPKKWEGEGEGVLRVIESKMYWRDVNSRKIYDGVQLFEALLQ